MITDLRSANVFSASNNAPPTTPPRNASQQSSPRFQRTTSPVRRTDLHPLSAQASPAGRTSEASATPSLPARRFSHHSPEEPAQQTEATAASTAAAKKRPLPVPPPKPSSLAAASHAPHAPAPNVSSVTEHPAAPVLPARNLNQPSSAARLVYGEEETAASRPATKVYTSIDELLNEPSNTASPAPNLPTRQQYTSLDDAVSASSPAPPVHHPNPPTHTPHRNHLLASSPYRSKPIMPARASPSGNEGCAGCGKTVYFAEGVNPTDHSSRERLLIC
jgi:hypothetical protein